MGQFACQRLHRPADSRAQAAPIRAGGRRNLIQAIEQQQHRAVAQCRTQMPPQPGADLALALKLGHEHPPEDFGISGGVGRGERAGNQPQRAEQRNGCLGPAGWERLAGRIEQMPRQQQRQVAQGRTVG
jgi:hypothetical protein